MRRGINPTKRSGLRSHRPARVGILSLNYIPSLFGFFEQSLEVLEVHLKSLRFTAADAEIWVFDNGSCSEAQTLLGDLYTQGIVDQLVLSHYNWGKSAVVQWGLQALPHEFIVFTDGDILFFPKWLEKALEIFEAYPETSMAGVFPVFFRDTSIKEMQEMTINKCRKHYICAGFAAANALHFPFQIVHPAPAESLEMFLLDIGAGFDPLKTPHRWAMAVHKGGPIEVSIGVRDFLFVLRREKARCLPQAPTEQALSPYNEWIHYLMAERGGLQLSTFQPYVRHMGNSLDGLDEVSDYLRQFSSSFPEGKVWQPRPQQFAPSFKKQTQRLVRKALRIKWFRRFLERVYHTLYLVLHSEG